MVSLLHRYRELLDSSCTGHSFIDLSCLCIDVVLVPVQIMVANF